MTQSFAACIEGSAGLVGFIGSDGDPEPGLTPDHGFERTTDAQKAASNYLARMQDPSLRATLVRHDGAGWQRVGVVEGRYERLRRKGSVTWTGHL